MVWIKSPGWMIIQEFFPIESRRKLFWIILVFLVSICWLLKIACIAIADLTCEISDFTRLLGFLIIKCSLAPSRNPYEKTLQWGKRHNRHNIILRNNDEIYNMKQIDLYENKENSTKFHLDEIIFLGVYIRIYNCTVNMCS